MSRQTQTHTTNLALTGDQRRHLLRRLVFAATPFLEQEVGGLTADAALSALLNAGWAAVYPDPPDAARGVWTNQALRLTGMTDSEYEALRDEQVRTSEREIEHVRQWWLQTLITNVAPLRENLVLFFHGVFGSTTSSVDAPHALHGRNALLRRGCLGTIPDLLEALVVDPAMMMQIGLDEHGLLRVSDRPAKLILDHWTVGAGAYDPRDVEELSRALTGWLLVAPDGPEPAPSIDPRAPRIARRTGLTPMFRPEEFDDGPKTILGTTRSFDARSAVRWLASQEATARRFSRLLIAYLGVEDPDRTLESRLVSTYAATDGSMGALLREVVRADEFWSAESRWSRWLQASGQTLLDTPNDGEGGWPGQEAWVTPPDRLAVRYHLSAALGGRLPPLGLEPPHAADPDTAGLPTVAVGATLRNVSASVLLERLDPAPGLDATVIERDLSAIASAEGRSAFIRRVMMTPQYQLA